MKSRRYGPKQETLEPNPWRLGRKPGERHPVVTFEEFDVIEPVPAPDEQKWKAAPGMPYDDGLAGARKGKLVEWSEEEKRELALHQSRGDKQAVVRMMNAKQEGTPRDIGSLGSR
jgi:hypothetical protein